MTQLLLEGFLVLCGLEQGVGPAVPLWLMGLAARTALVTLLTPMAVIPAATRAVAVEATIRSAFQTTEHLQKHLLYRGIRKALLYLFPSSGYGNDNNYVKVNTKSKMSYTLRTG